MRVMKFGGTSVADVSAVTRLIDIVRRQRERDLPAGADVSAVAPGPVVVVSALGGATDRLLEIRAGGAGRRCRRRGEGALRPARSPCRDGERPDERRAARRRARRDPGRDLGRHRAGARARRAAGRLAAVARRAGGRRRADEQPPGRGGAGRGGAARRLGRRPQGHHHRRRPHERDPADRGDQRPAARAGRAAARGGADPRARRIHGGDGRRQDHDAGARRIRLFRRHRRRRSRGRRDPDSGPTSTAC